MASSVPERLNLAEAIRQLRDQLREAVLERGDQDIVFTPGNIELELAITFGTEKSVGGGLKLLAFLDLSADSKASQSNQHKVKITLNVADAAGRPLMVRSGKLPSNA